MMIVWQIGHQRRNEIDGQRENFKIELRLRVYQEMSTKVLPASDALGAAAMYAFCMPGHMKLAAQGPQNDYVQAVSDRAKAFLDLDSRAHGQLSEVVLMIEKYLIIHPDLDIFRMALSSADHDLRTSFPALFDFMLQHFPMDVMGESGATTINVRRFSPQECEQVGDMAMRYYDRASDAQAFLMDIQAELQQLLLGPLFPNKPPRRVPADPSKRVLSLDPAAVKSLRQYFLKNTDWGRSAVATSLEVHQHFHGRI